MIHLEGWIIVPHGGQRRFGVQFEPQGDLTFVERRPDYDPWFMSNPINQPSCRDLETKDRLEIDHITKAVKRVRQEYGQTDNLAPGVLLTQRMENGVKVVFHNPKLIPA